MSHCEDNNLDRMSRNVAREDLVDQRTYAAARFGCRVSPSDLCQSERSVARERLSSVTGLLHRNRRSFLLVLMMAFVFTSGCIFSDKKQSPEVPAFMNDLGPAPPFPFKRGAGPNLPNVDRANLARSETLSTGQLISRPESIRRPASEPGAVNDLESDHLTITLDEVRQLAMSASPDIRLAIARLDEAHAQITHARANYYPQVSTQLGLSENFDLDSGNGLIPATSINRETGSSSDEFLDFYTNISLLLFDGSVRRRTLEAAQLDSESSEVGILESQRLLIEEINNVYFAAVLTQLRMVIAEEDIQFNEQLKSNVAQRREAGMASKSELLNFKVKAGEAERNYLTTRREYGVLLAAMSALMNLPTPLPPDETRLIVPGYFDRTEEDLSFDSAYDFAWNHRQDIQQIKIELERNRVEQSIERGRYWPRISLDSNYSIGLLETETANSVNPSQSGAAGMVMRWNAFEGGRRVANVRGKVAQGAQINATLQRAGQNLQAELGALRQEILINRRLVTTQAETLAAAQEDRDLVMNLYASGLVSVTRLNDVQKDYIYSANSTITSKVRLHLAWKKWDTALGRINPESQRLDIVRRPPVTGHRTNR